MSKDDIKKAAARRIAARVQQVIKTAEANDLRIVAYEGNLVVADESGKILAICSEEEPS